MANSCRKNAATVVSDRAFRATIKWLTLTVSTWSSGQAEFSVETLGRIPRIRNADASGAMASDASIAELRLASRRAVAAMASEVDFAVEQPTAVNASGSGRAQLLDFVVPIA